MLFAFPKADRVRAGMSDGLCYALLEIQRWKPAWLPLLVSDAGVLAILETSCLVSCTTN